MADTLEIIQSLVQRRIEDGSMHPAQAAVYVARWLARMKEIDANEDDKALMARWDQEGFDVET
jgi:hypothetical protein